MRKQIRRHDLEPPHLRRVLPASPRRRVRAAAHATQTPAPAALPSHQGEARQVRRPTSHLSDQISPMSLRELPQHAPSIPLFTPHRAATYSRVTRLTHAPKVKRAKFIAAETRRRRAESSLVKQAQLDDKLDAAAARRASSRASSPLSSPLARPAKRCAPPPTTAALMRG